MIQRHIKTDPDVILRCDVVEHGLNGLFEYTVSLRLLKGSELRVPQGIIVKLKNHRSKSINGSPCGL
jgi:hypothetical protein